MLILKILAAVAALGLGIWLGLPGRYEARYDEIDRSLASPYGKSRRAKRHFTPLAWLQRNVKVSTGRPRRSTRGTFQMDRPKDR